MTVPFLPPAGTRFPVRADEYLAFEATGLLRRRLSLDNLLEYHAPEQRRFTLLAASPSQITAAACFEVRPLDLFIDYLARNRLLTPGSGVPGVRGSFWRSR